MKKLTDEMVAKALGWKYHLFPGPKSKCLVPGYWVDEGLHERGTQAPAFTTSLDAIVAEIEARKLAWSVELCAGWSYMAHVREFKTNPAFSTAKTAPLALCATLLAYLKVTP